MAFLAAIPAWVGTAMAVAGAVSAVAGGMAAADAAETQAKRQKEQLDFQAAQQDQAAGQAIAASQRDAFIQRREATLVKSRALALAGASGGGVTDPTVVNLIGDIAGQGAYRAGVALYQGEEKARQLRMGATADRYSGEVALDTGANKASAYRIQGISQAFGSASSLYGKYGAGGPGAAGATSTAAGGSNLLDAGITPMSIG